MATIKNGTSVHDLKDFMITSVSPKYFDKIKNLSELNVGLYGYVTDVLGNSVKDSFGATTSLFKEMFVTQAELPESIYDHALVYQLDNTFAKAASVPFTILVAEDTVIKNGTMVTDYSYFDMDCNMQFLIDGKPFMLDYDVRIMTKQTTNGYVHSAQYLMNKQNAISNLRNPYIRSSIYINTNKKRYIILEVILHQVAKRTISDTIIQNDKLNCVTLSYLFSDTLADFDVYYKAPSESSYVQLKKVLENSYKPNVPFCFYRLIDENKIQISFTDDENYFQPKYNSEIIIELYTTLGEEGNFDVYEGADIRVIGKADKYASNRGVIFIGTVTGSSTGGTNLPDLEELREETIKAYSTVKSFTTSNDLNLYFSDMIAESSNTKVAFMKKRDDAFERLFSAFVLFRDGDKNVVPTNTLDLMIYPRDISVYLESTHRHVIPAGKLFEFIKDDDTGDYHAEVASDITMDSDLDEYEKTRFLYCNPFMTIVCTSPLSVGFYFNTVDDMLSVTHRNIQTSAFNQFIIDNLSISRDALAGENQYKLKVDMYPTATLPLEAFKRIKTDTKVEPTDVTFHNDYDGYDYIDNLNLCCILEILDKGGSPKIYVPLKLVGFDNEAYKFEGSIETNDYISTSHMFQVTGGFKTLDMEDPTDPVLVPATDCRINIYTLYRYPDEEEEQTHKFARFEQYKYHQMTNMYTLTDDMLANFIVPVQEIRSYVQYASKNSEGKYGFRLEAVPLIKANYMKMDTMKKQFMTNFKYIYNYIRAALDALTNNFHIDMKFFNTYGYSQHYFIANSENEHIDKVNVSLRYSVKYTLATDAESTTQALIEYIKELTEATTISLTSSPSWYNSDIINACKEKFSGIKYMLFEGINEYGSTVQAVESDVNESNIIQGVIETSKVIPEYLNIDQIIKEGTLTPQIFIDVL